MKVQIVIEQGKDGYFVASCPSLKSCWSQGKTRDEALTNIREAIELFLDSEHVEVHAGENREVLELAI